ncbi:hypothetical protein GQ42DRAFT_156231 [Ramicandelaber brevisporus]|nr:hypothetical protein GQ42DRAFT_156231 [Ramicandelaber brevisporus]
MFAKESRSPGSTPAAQVASLRRRPVKSTAIGAASVTNQQQQQQQQQRSLGLGVSDLAAASTPSMPRRRNVSTALAGGLSSVRSSSDIEMIDDMIDEDGYGGIDEADITRGKVFLNTGTTLVQLAGRIPSELSDDFNEAGQSAPGCYAVVHATSGFAAWVTERTCTVWKYNGSIANSNIRTYVLPMPAPSHDSIWSGVPPTVILVNSDSSTSNSDDVGLLAIAQTGEMRYWPSVALGLSGNNQSQYLSARVMLNPDDGDRVTHVVDMSISGGDGLVLVTAGGRLFRLLLINSHNNAELTCTPVVRSTPVVGRATLILMKAAGMAKMALSAGLGKPDIVSELGPVVYASNGAQGDEPRSSELILLTAHTVEKWIVPPANDGSPMRLLCAHEASPLIKSALGGDKFVARLTLLAATAGASNEIIILAKYVPPNPRATEADLINATGVYVLVNLHVSSQTAAVASIRRLNYVPGPIAANHSQNLPLLLVPNGGPGVFVVFADAIVMTAVADIDYYYCIPLEHDVILGAAGTVDQCAAVMLCTGLSNVIRSDIDAARLELRTHDPAAAHRAKLLRSRHNTIQPEQSPSGRSQGKHLDDRQQIQELSEEDRAELYAARVEQLTSLVEQAVHFGQASANPLLFALTNNDIDSIGDDALETAVIAVARSILDSTSEFAPTTLDTKAHLRARFTSMDAIIRFLRARQLLTTEVSPRTRADLLSMTQMLAAAVGFRL